MFILRVDWNLITDNGTNRTRLAVYGQSKFHGCTSSRTAKHFPTKKYALWPVVSYYWWIDGTIASQNRSGKITCRKVCVNWSETWPKTIALRRSQIFRTISTSVFLFGKQPKRNVWWDVTLIWYAIAEVLNYDELCAYLIRVVYKVNKPKWDDQ